VQTNLSPLVTHITQDRTVRLIATARKREPVLSKLASEDELDALAEIEGATSGRLLAEERGADKLDRRELVFGVPHARFINAAFCYYLPKALNRFNGPGRGAWYAALAAETCVAEVTFHMNRELAAIDDYNATVEYSEVFASFVGDFVDLRDVTPTPECLHPDPERSYAAGNRLADEVRAQGQYGIIWHSLRHPGGTCLVALTPHAVQSVAQGQVLRFKWAGTPNPQITRMT
jgi:hypothetical protein